MGKNTQARKYQLTLNNPIEKNYTHESLKENLLKFKSLVYFCMADEIGENKTPHTHVFVAFTAPVRFSTIKNAFPEAHIEKSLGTSEQNRDYVKKSGKWENDIKHGTAVEGTFEEYGELPQEKQGHRKDLDELYSMIESGMSTYEIISQQPSHMEKINIIERVRQILVQEAGKTEFRNLIVTYIFGATGTGKTRYVMEQYGYESVFRVTDYSHPFDNYLGQDVVCFDEFSSNLRIQDMLNYLDGYPLELPCRYSNKWACYSKVYIISNIELKFQYSNVQVENPEVWQALLRRIHVVMAFFQQKTVTYTVHEYLNGFVELDDSYIPEKFKNAENQTALSFSPDCGTQLAIPDTKENSGNADLF